MSKTKEKAGIESEILKSFRAGVLVIDRQGKIKYINDIGRRILDLPSDRMIASPRDPFFKVLFSSFDLDYLPSRVEIELTTRGRGEKKIIGITLSDITYRKKRVAIVAFFKDLSHIDNLSQAESLKSRLVVLGQMAAGIAHEIRNPLASIKIYTELIKKKSTGNALDSLMESILKDIGKIEDIVNQSLYFVRPEELLKKPVNIHVLIEAILYSLKSIYPNVTFQVNLVEVPDEITALVDEQLFSQALQNILHNAAESYESGEGKVVISTTVAEEYSDILRLSGQSDLKSKLGVEQRRKYLYMSVKDFGPGIRSDVVEKIFTPFFTTKKKGTGIGLPISQKIIHSHDGVIDVVSKEGKGTEFRIKIPID